MRKWNSFSRITVNGDPKIPTGVITEGISNVYPDSQQTRQLQLTIDGSAATTITHFDGTFNDLGYLKYDVKKYRPSTPFEWQRVDYWGRRRTRHPVRDFDGAKKDSCRRNQPKHSPYG